MGMEKTILEILSRGNNAEVKQNKNGDITIMEVAKKIKKVVKEK